MNTNPAVPVFATPPTEEERNWAMVIHLSAFAGHLFPLAHVIVPFIIWQVKRESSAFLDDQGKEAVNAQLTVTILGAIALVLCLILVGFLLLFCLWVTTVIFVILAALAAQKGQAYRYPYILRLVK